MVFDKIIDWFLKGYVNAFLSPKLVNIKHFKEIRFECIEDCGDCCKKGMVCVAEKEMQDKDLEEKLKGNLYVLENKYQKGANLIIMREGELIKKTKYGECIFLDKNKCSIYSNKPLVCNSYPISVDPFDNEVYIDTSKMLFVHAVCFNSQKAKAFLGCSKNQTRSVALAKSF